RGWHVIEQETDLDGRGRPLGPIRNEVRDVAPREILLDELERHVAVHLAVDVAVGETLLLQAKGTLVERHLLDDVTRVHDHETELGHGSPSPSCLTPFPPGFQPDSRSSAVESLASSLPAWRTHVCA